ncbi:MAG: pantoate--beta-alanine ligase [Deltaproteobacteria bacterium]|nr:MAG: pantoate--beta-alanine ligase [Deltaproteobacteria bacterium]
MTSPPRLLGTRAELRSACDAAREAGKTVGIVPTMGALHAGHLSLIERARQEGATFVVVTIFVNPLQFGEGEDLARYPRTLSADIEACTGALVDVVFVPDDGEMYDANFATTVAVSGMTTDLEGAHRPGHFDGVTTVVAKLLCLTAPTIAVFGRKDHQQQAVIHRMATDLGIRARVVAAPTIREKDGLALSSRNLYLAPDERKRATGIVEGLRAADALFRHGERNPGTLAEAAREKVAAAFDTVDYVEAVDPTTLAPVPDGASSILIVVAAHIGGTRLIDNAILGEDRL